MNTTYIQKTKPSCIHVPKDTKSIKNSHLNASRDLQMPSSPTPPNAQTTMKQSTLPTQKASTAPMQPQWTRKPPLLPTPTVPAQQHRSRTLIWGPPWCNIKCQQNSNFPRPSPFITRPSLIYNRFHQQPHIPGPHTARFYNQQPPLLPSPPYHQQRVTPGPYQHAPGHLTQQVLAYLPVFLPYPNHLIGSLLYMYAV